jgi:hypothetical protein
MVGTKNIASSSGWAMTSSAGRFAAAAAEVDDVLAGSGQYRKTRRAPTSTSASRSTAPHAATVAGVTEDISTADMVGVNRGPPSQKVVVSQNPIDAHANHLSPANKPQSDFFGLAFPSVYTSRMSSQVRRTPSRLRSRPKSTFSPKYTTSLCSLSPLRPSADCYAGVRAARRGTKACSQAREEREEDLLRVPRCVSVPPASRQCARRGRIGAPEPDTRMLCGWGRGAVGREESRGRLCPEPSRVRTREEGDAGCRCRLGGPVLRAPYPSRPLPSPHHRPPHSPLHPPPSSRAQRPRSSATPASSRTGRTSAGRRSRRTMRACGWTDSTWREEERGG